MSRTTSIEWTERVWNPVTGCTRASAGCDNCYAVAMTRRLAGMGQEKYKGLVNPGKHHFNGVVKCNEDVLSLPLRVKKPTRFFVNSMSDLFHDGVPFEFIDRVFAVMALCPQHTFQILTKRAARMTEYMNQPGLWGSVCAAAALDTDTLSPLHPDFDLHHWPLQNVWLGVSVESQAAADERIPHLLKTPAAVRWLSMEPLLGPVELITRWFFPVPFDFDNRSTVGLREAFDNDLLKPLQGISWVVVGGESGPHARPMHPDWVRSIRDQCAAADVPFFFKQWGEYIPRSQGKAVSREMDWEMMRFPLGKTPAFDLDIDGKRVTREWQCADGRCVTVYRFRKARTGRLLDGREHNDYPETLRPALHGSQKFPETAAKDL